MKIGIKYCGGCNCHYDRTKEVDALKKRCPQHEFTYRPEQDICDMCLLVCGCMTACASSEGIAAKSFKLLCSPAQFSQLADVLQAQSAVSLTEGPKCVGVGHTASLQKTITAGDVQAFAALTGNYGKLHTDPSFAAHCGFVKPLIPPSLLEGILSSLLTTHLLGDGAIMTKSVLQFPAPAFVGTTLHATATITEITSHEQGYAAEIQTVCTNEQGTILAKGTYSFVLPQPFFTCRA